MRKEIKFRGRSINSGELVYGDLVHTDTEAVNIRYIEKNFCGVAGRVVIFVKEVEPYSVAQLIGYDADGNEVYEGDTLFDNYGKSEVADLVVGLITEESFNVACDAGDTLYGYRLERGDV